MAVSAAITGNCRFMSLVMSGASGFGTLIVRNNGVTYTVPVNLPGGNGSFNSILNLENTIGQTSGIYQIELKDSAGIIHYTGAFAPCVLECCISKKVSSILTCDCGCSKCDSALLQAERVSLLLQSIKADLSQIGNFLAENSALYAAAQRKYEKALELCSDSCGCNC